MLDTTIVPEKIIETEVILPEENGFAAFGLPKFLLEGLDRLDYTRPTRIQASAIPILMTGKDLVAQSVTGSGKTAAFSIPLLARIQRKSSDLQALVIVPTRELALQITNVIKGMAGPAVRVTAIYGGVDMNAQIRGLNRGGYQVVVGTPGRLKDHLNRGHLRLDKLRMLVLDEADEMLERGFAEDIETLIQATSEAKNRQIALFSATMREWVLKVASKYLSPDHESILLEQNTHTRPDIEHIIYRMKHADKASALHHLLDTYDSNSILVFARTKNGVERLANRLQEAGYSAAGLQGNLSQRNRDEVMAAFRHRRVRIMVATNVGARGLDVTGISHVINYDLPESAELFTHRVGRTGRNGESGTAITFLTGEDKAKWREIESAIVKNGIPLQHKNWDGQKAGDQVATPVADKVAHVEFSRSYPPKKFNDGRSPARSNYGRGYQDRPDRSDNFRSRRYR